MTHIISGNDRRAIYEAVRVLYWLNAMQRKTEPPVYPYIQDAMRRLLNLYEDALRPASTEDVAKERTVTQVSG